MTDLHNSYANARDKTIDLDVTPVTGTIGAIVNGVQLSGRSPDNWTPYTIAPIVPVTGVTSRSIFLSRALA